MKKIIPIIILMLFVIGVFNASFSSNMSKVFDLTATKNVPADNQVVSSVHLRPNLKLQTPPPPQAGLTSHAIIQVNGNSQLASASNSGSGTVSDPYLIANWNITDSSTTTGNIWIQNTNKPTIIENCYINTENIVGGLGIYLNYANNITIKNVYITDSDLGIYTFYSNNIQVLNNTVLVNSVGIQLETVNNGKISFNYVSPVGSSIQYGGIDVNSPSNSSVDNNQVYFAQYGLDIEYSFNTSVFSNYVLSAPSSNTYGIYIYIANLDLFSSNQVLQTPYGVYLQYTRNSVFTKNIVTVNTNVVPNYGIYLTKSDKNSISNNDIIGESQYGSTTTDIYLTHSNYNKIDSNSMSNATNSLEIDYSDWNNVSSDIFLAGWGNGTLIYKSFYTLISNSIFNGSLDFDIILDNGSGNKVIENTFEKANFYDVVIVDGEYGATVEKNSFLTSRPYDGSQALDSGINDQFIYNYWLGWTSPDQNHDGIVDYPFAIDGSAHSYDLKPLASQQEITIVGEEQGNTINSSNTSTASTSNSSNLTGSPNIPNIQYLALFTGLGLIGGLVISVVFRKIRK